MANYKKKLTKYPNIYEYETKKGKKYAVRIGYTIHGETDEFNQSGIRTLAEARSILRDVEDKIEKEEMGLVNNRKITVREYYQIFRTEKIESKEWTDQSISSYDSHFVNHLLPSFGDRSVASVSRSEYQSFLNRKLHEENFSVATARTFNNSFNALINHAVANGTLERNRFKRMTFAENDRTPRQKVLSLDQYKRFLETADEKFEDDVLKRCMIYLTTFGLRRGEIMGLIPKNVSVFDSDGLARIDVVLTRTLKNPEGKGTKTPSSERIIVLDQKGTDLVVSAIREASEIKKDYGEILHQEDFVFINQKNNEPFHVTYLNTLMKQVSERCGFHVSPHMMRHTFATQARLSGASDRYVSDYLGHKTISMTDHYTHRTDEGMKSVIDLFEKRVK